MAMIKCPECGKEISDQSKECIHCGYSLLKNEMEKDISYKICPECRQRVSNNVNSCPNCGLPLCKPKRLKSNKSLFVAHWLNIIALILPIILVALSYLWEYFLPDNKSETNSGVTVSVDTNSVFNPILLHIIIIVGILTFLIGLLIYILKSKKIKLTLSIIYLVIAIGNFSFLIMSMALLILMTCGILSVILIPGILQIIAGAKFVSGAKDYVG